MRNPEGGKIPSETNETDFESMVRRTQRLLGQYQCKWEELKRALEQSRSAESMAILGRYSTSLDDTMREVRSLLDRLQGRLSS